MRACTYLMIPYMHTWRSHVTAIRKDDVGRSPKKSHSRSWTAAASSGVAAALLSRASSAGQGFVFTARCRTCRSLYCRWFVPDHLDAVLERLRRDGIRRRGSRRLFRRHRLLCCRMLSQTCYMLVRTWYILRSTSKYCITYRWVVLLLCTGVSDIDRELGGGQRNQRKESNGNTIHLLIVRVKKCIPPSAQKLSFTRICSGRKRTEGSPIGGGAGR